MVSSVSSPPMTVLEGHDGGAQDPTVSEMGGHFASPSHTAATTSTPQSGIFRVWTPEGDAATVSKETGQGTPVYDGGLLPRPMNTRMDMTGTSTEFFGESSTFDFMIKICCSDSVETETTSRGSSSLSTVCGVLPSTMTAAQASSSLATSSPSAPIFEGLVLGLENDGPFGLPHRFVADRLVDAYFKFRHPLNAYLHENSFRTRYHRLWLSEDRGGEEATEANLAWLGLVNLVFAFGSEYTRAVSRSAAAVDRTRFFQRAKTLVFSGLLQAGSIELVQALLDRKSVV